MAQIAQSCSTVPGAVSWPSAQSHSQTSKSSSGPLDPGAELLCGEQGALTHCEISIVKDNNKRPEINARLYWLNAVSTALLHSAHRSILLSPPHMLSLAAALSDYIGGEWPGTLIGFNSIRLELVPTYIVIAFCEASLLRLG